MTKRIISLLLVICMVVSLMPMSVLAQEIAISNMVLDCPYVVHEHSEECYDESGNLICGQVDYVFHEHDGYCYDSDGNLVCLLDGVEEHLHDLNDCYDENSKLICPCHQHNYGCFRAQKEEVVATSASSTEVSPLYISGIDYSTDEKTKMKYFYTGDEPFDGNDDPGNDSSADNNIVRSFDKISYGLGVTRNYRGGSSPAILTETTRMYFEMTIDADISEAKFDLDQFASFYPTGDNGVVVQYTIDFLDENDEVVATQSHDGTITDKNGNTYSDVNALIYNNNTDPEEKGGTTQASQVYRSKLGIVSQRFTGYQDLGNNASGYNSFNAGVMVQAAKHGKIIQPTFKVWIEGNEENYKDYSGTVSKTVDKDRNEIDTNILISEEVTVSATNNFNMKLEKNYVCNELGWFNFVSGVKIKEGMKIDISGFEQTNIENILKSVGVDVFDWANNEDEFVPCVDAYVFLEKLGLLPCNKGKADPSTFLIQGNAVEGVNTDTTQYALPQSVANAIKYCRYGRINGFGLTMQLHPKVEYTDVPLDESYPDQEELALIKAKGIRGCTLPEGELSFDINFYTSVYAHSSSEEDLALTSSSYTPILWDVSENVFPRRDYLDNAQYSDEHKIPYNSKSAYVGSIERNMNWLGNSYYAFNSAACNYNYNPRMLGCYYGGDWNYLGIKNGEQSTVDAIDPDPLTVKGNGDDIKYNGADTKYRINVSDFDFDFAFDNDSFPKMRTNNSFSSDNLYAEYEKCFSAGYFQVLAVFPRDTETSVSYKLYGVVDELEITSQDGTVTSLPLEAEEGEDREARKADNTDNIGVNIFNPGDKTKASSFNGRMYTESGYTVARPTQYHWNGFLGTNWNSVKYDSAAYAGDNIAIIGSSGISNTTDNIIYGIQHTQLFDTRAFSLIEGASPEVYFIDNNERTDAVGSNDYTVEYWYVCDRTLNENGEPIYKDGYDTNADGVLEHMNKVVYYKTNPDKTREEVLKEGIQVLAATSEVDKIVDGRYNGYKVVGVYAQVTFKEGVDFTGRMYLKIPVKVNDQDADLVGKTVATVNFAAFDTKRARNNNNGVSIYAESIKNIVDYEEPNDGNKPYTKVEYDVNNLLMPGSDNAGPLAGNSLLILDYKTMIGIKTTKTTDSNPTPQYDLTTGDRKVEYVLNGIRTKSSDSKASEAHEKTADLNIRVNIDAANSIEEDMAEHQTDAENYGDETYESITKRLRRLKIYDTDEIRMVGDVYAVDEDKVTLGESLDSVDISYDSENPTYIGIKSGDEEFVIKVYAVIDPDGYGFELNILDAPIGITMPEVKFFARFINLSDIVLGQDITARAYIKTEDDLRAYIEGKNNNAKTVVRAYRNQNTKFAKTVDKDVIELNGEFTYTMSYGNGTETYSEATPMYMYDILPYNGDSRLDGSKSKFDDDGVFADVKPEIYLNDVDVSGTYKYTVSAYYSTVPASTLNDMFNELKLGESVDTDGIELLVKNSNVFTPYELGVEKYDSQLAYECSTQGEIAGITCVLIKVTPLTSNSTIVLNLNVKTKGNKAADLYVNDANFVIAKDECKLLTAGTPKTRVISRSISGVVWYDANQNGKRDTNEKVLPDVEASLYTLVGLGASNNELYKSCRTDVRGEDIGTVKTDGEGKYIFEALPAGKYVVRFSVPNYFIDATLYQASGVSSQFNNDALLGKIQLSTELGGVHAEFVYSNSPKITEIGNGPTDYFSKFSSSVNYIELHTIEKFPSDRYEEAVNNIDLGLITEDRFPQVGGEGTIMFIFGGALLMVASMVAGLLIFSKKKKEIIK